MVCLHFCDINTVHSTYFYLFISLAITGRHVVFGKVLEGLDIVYKIEAVGSPDGGTSKVVKIVKSGELPMEAGEAEL